QIAVRFDGETVQQAMSGRQVVLALGPGLAAGPTQDREAVEVDSPDAVVGAVRHVHKLPARFEGQVERRAEACGPGGDLDLAQKPGALGGHLEFLDSAFDAVTDVHASVKTSGHLVYGIAEAFLRRQ